MKNRLISLILALTSSCAQPLAFATTPRETGQEIMIMKEQGSAPATPASGKRKVYAKSDGLYQKDASGNETKVGSGGGTLNLLQAYNPDLESNTTSPFTLGNASVDATSKTLTGTPTFGSGASGNLSIAVESATPINGSYSLNYVSSAATTAGNFVSTAAFPVSVKYQAQSLSFYISYVASSGASNMNFSGTTANSYGVAVYDVTNSAWVTVTDGFSMTQSSGAGIFSGEFQTSATGTSYRIMVYNANATAGAATVRLDDFEVSPGSFASGADDRDWVSWTPTGSWTANTSYAGRWKKVGDTMEGEVRLDLTGAPTSTSLTINLPPGAVIDQNKRTALATADDNRVGFGSVLDAGTARYLCFVNTASTTTLKVIVSVDSGSGYVSSNSNITQTIPFTFANGDAISFNFRVPIAGWTSNTTVDNGYHGRTLGMYAVSTSTASIPTGSTPTTLTGFTALRDDAAMLSGTNTVTIPATGWWVVGGGSAFASTTNSYIAQLDVFKNGTRVTSFAYSRKDSASNQALYIAGASPPLYFLAGDQITIRITHGHGGSLSLSGDNKWQYFSVMRASGAVTVAASQKVFVKVYKNAGTAPATTGTKVSSYTGKLKDTHDAFNLSTGEFTCPSSGDYGVMWHHTITSQTDYWTPSVFLAGTEVATGLGYIGVTGRPAQGAVSTTVQDCQAGQVIDVRGADGTAGGETFSSSNTATQLSIWKIK